MFRLAETADIDRIEEIYSHIHDSEESGQAVIGWNRAIYPTRKTALEAVDRKEMFVEEQDGVIVASGRINTCQGEEYSRGGWLYDAPDDEVMVLHTLVVDPAVKGGGFGSRFMEFYEQYAKTQNRPYLRIDTNEKNMAARSLYKKLGYREAGVVTCNFNGLPDVRLVLLEKKL